MTPTRQGIIWAARSCIGTRWTHQGRDKNGFDCIGLCLYALATAGWQPRNPQSTLFDRYGRESDNDAITAALQDEAAEIAIDTALPADLLLMHCDGFQFPQHLAFVSGARGGNLTIIHAIARSPRRVVEQRMDAQMERDVVSAWRLRGLD